MLQIPIGAAPLAFGSRFHLPGVYELLLLSECMCLAGRTKEKGADQAWRYPFSSLMGGGTT